MRFRSGMRTAGVVAMVSLAVFTGKAGARTYAFTVESVLPGGANAGGVEFEGWRYSDFSFRQEGSFALRAADIDVHITPRDGDPASMHTVLFAFYRDDAPAGDAGRFFIDYTVRPAPGDSISRVGVRMASQVPTQGIGAGSLNVVEKVSTLDGGDLTPEPPARDAEVLTVFNDGPGRLADTNAASVLVGPVAGVRLSKELTLSLRDTGPLAVMFSDTLFAVPEPASAALIALAASIGLCRRPVTHRTRAARRVN